jgi:GNAT superfamily N-acetyltransferase
MTLRRLGREDWRILRAVRLEALGDAPSAFGSTLAEESGYPDAWWQEGVERLPWFPGVTMAWFVVEIEETVVGVAGGVPPREDDDCSQLISMWVRPDQRGSGRGDELVRAVIDWAQTIGAAGVRLDVADGNDRARRFYERAGFVATGHSRPLHSNPSVMTRELRLEWD